MVRLVSSHYEDVSRIVQTCDDLRDRLMFVADLCARCAMGDLAQIGAGRGGMTTALAAVARKHGRRLVVVDPWQVGVEGCQDGDREIFRYATVPYRDIVEVWEHDSLAASTTEDMMKIPLCFAYVDGLRTYPAALVNLITVSHATIIAIRPDGLEFAVNLFGGMRGRVVLREGGREEAYLL